MNKTVAVFFAVICVICVIKSCKTLKVSDLKEPESYKEAMKMAEKDPPSTRDLAKNIVKANRENCMPNCALVPTCHILSPECCPVKKPICYDLDIVKEAMKKQQG
uniref:U-scoloptoxin(10)-Cw1a n=1 Tax=Cormocephalus westwoodi TaxID=1096223 RepID=TXA1A_CORWE|nr:RecName: Full=U-scoloptoxin(10)-Cw1a; Short=U-SLPTX(10)-Cw1a; Flags: Precursor [Cormocephalus westwoodi]